MLNKLNSVYIKKTYILICISAQLTVKLLFINNNKKRAVRPLSLSLTKNKQEFIVLKNDL